MHLKIVTLAAAAALLTLTTPATSLAQEQAPAGTEEQRTAMADLSFLDGEWRGEAIVYGPGGRETFTQTERVGPMLGGSIRIVEGRGYDAAGETVFNAFAVISWNDAEDRYQFRAWANGRNGDYRFERTPDGFIWEVPAGPGAIVRYTATVQGGVWHEAGVYIREGGQPMPFMEMTLHRIGDSPWPGAGAVSPR